MAISWKEVALVEDLQNFTSTDQSSNTGSTVADHGVPYGEADGSFSYATASTAADILVADASLDPVWVALSGDVTIATGGAVSIANNAVDNAAIADNAVNLDEMAHGVEGDILIYGDSGVPLRLAHGSAGQSLIIDSDGNDNRPKWGTASGAGTITVTEHDNSDETVFLTFTATAAGAGCTVERDADLSYKPDTQVLTSPKFAGALTGIASQATKVKTTGASNSQTYYPVFSSGSAGEEVDLISSNAFLSIATSTGGASSTFTVAGDLVVNGTTTTISTSNLEVEDKVIKLAINATTPGTGAESGICVDTGSSTDAHNPRLIWSNNANSAGATTNTTTGWAVADHGTLGEGDFATVPVADSVLHGIAVMKLGTADTAISTLDVGIGAMAWTTDGHLYIQSSSDIA